MPTMMTMIFCNYIQQANSPSGLSQDLKQKGMTRLRITEPWSPSLVTQYPQHLVSSIIIIFIHTIIRPMGSGKITVEFFSALMLFSVWKISNFLLTIGNVAFFLKIWKDKKKIICMLGNKKINFWWNQVPLVKEVEKRTLAQEHYSTTSKTGRVEVLPPVQWGQRVIEEIETDSQDEVENLAGNSR